MCYNKTLHGHSVYPQEVGKSSTSGAIACVKLNIIRVNSNEVEFFLVKRGSRTCLRIGAIHWSKKQRHIIEEA